MATALPTCRFSSDAVIRWRFVRLPPSGAARSNSDGRSWTGESRLPGGSCVANPAGKARGYPRVGKSVFTSIAPFGSPGVLASEGAGSVGMRLSLVKQLR